MGDFILPILPHRTVTRLDLFNYSVVFSTIEFLFKYLRQVFANAIEYLELITVITIMKHFYGITF